MNFKGVRHLCDRCLPAQSLGLLNAFLWEELGGEAVGRKERRPGWGLLRRYGGARLGCAWGCEKEAVSGEVGRLAVGY